MEAKDPLTEEQRQFSFKGKVVTYVKAGDRHVGNNTIIYPGKIIAFDDVAITTKKLKTVFGIPEIIAIKCLKPKSTDRKDATDDFNRQMDSQLGKIFDLQHDNLVRYFTAYLHEPYIREPIYKSLTTAIVMEYVNGGNLQEFIKGVVLPIEQVRSFTKQILSGLVYLHENQVIHTDLKPENILMKDIRNEKQLKIADFDNPELLEVDITQSDVLHAKGTQLYMSPEMASLYFCGPQPGKKVGRKTDIWSLGCTVLDMVRGREKCIFINRYNSKEVFDPESLVSKQRLLSFVFYGGMPATDFVVDPELKDFVSKCLQNEAARRPKSAELLSSSFLSAKTCQGFIDNGQAIGVRLSKKRETLGQEIDIIQSGS